MGFVVLATAETSNPRLLIVDNDPSVLASLQFSLELEGFEVDTCRSAESLLERSNEMKVACLVIDYRLPGIDGLKLLRALRERGEASPAIIITTNPNRTVRERTVEAGAILIEKPLLSDGLTVAIRRAIVRTCQ